MCDMQGVITKQPTGTEDYSIQGKFKVPINFHVGSLGLAQATNATVDSVPPHMGGQHFPHPHPLRCSNPLALLSHQATGFAHCSVSTI